MIDELPRITPAPRGHRGGPLRERSHKVWTPRSALCSPTDLLLSSSCSKLCALLPVNLGASPFRPDRRAIPHSPLHSPLRRYSHIKIALLAHLVAAAATKKARDAARQRDGAFGLFRPNIRCCPHLLPLAPSWARTAAETTWQPHRPFHPNTSDVRR